MCFGCLFYYCERVVKITHCDYKFGFSSFWFCQFLLYIILGCILLGASKSRIAMFFWWSIHFIIIPCHSISLMHCCCSVQWLNCVLLCNPVDCSTPDFPVLLCLLEFAQTQVHWVGDAIQSSHPLLPPSPPALIFPSIRVFSNESALLIMYWSFTLSINPSNE